MQKQRHFVISLILQKIFTSIFDKLFAIQRGTHTKRAGSCQSIFDTTIPFPNKPWFLLVCSISLLKTLGEKEKLLVTSNFSFSYNVFYPFKELSAILIKFKIVVCKLSQFGRV